MREARVMLVGKPGCHLCDEAREVIAAVCADQGVDWVEVSILDDPDLADRYWEKIPVTVVDGVEHDFWRVDAARLRAALVTDNR
ncbi:MAG: glutaredoxin family protein [Actinomycetota bacterium]